MSDIVSYVVLGLTVLIVGHRVFKKIRKALIDDGKIDVEEAKEIVEEVIVAAGEII